MEVALINLGDNLADPSGGGRRTDERKHLDVMAQAVAAEAAGFDVLLLGEHHFNYFTISSPVTVLAAIAQQTECLRLGTGVTLLATRDPVFVAEEIATLDVVSGGRAEVAVGRGIHQQIYDVVGRSADAATEMVDEGLELLVRLLNEESVTWSGQWRPPLDDITIRPRPVQDAVPVWSGSTSAVERCARLGVPCMWVSTVYPFEHLEPISVRYRDAWQENGRELADMEVGIGIHCHVAATSQQARDRFRPHFAHYFDASAAIPKAGLKRAVAVQARDMSLFDTVPLVGSPAEIVDRIGAAHELLGITRIGLALDLGGLSHDAVLDQISLLGAQVIPELP